MNRPNRILIYGVTGSGKSSLARQLSEATGLPHICVDDLTHLPNWEQVPKEEQRTKLLEICAKDQWILDGAYSCWSDIVLERADLVIALDYPRLVSLFRLLRRCIQRAIDQKPICNGNRETWRMMLSRDSIILWYFKSFVSKRARIR